MKENLEVWPGEPYPLGATFDGIGTNFALFSEAAEKVELCLFDESGAETRIRMPEQTGFCWHCYIPNLGPGQRYGYRLHGTYDPERGLRCHPSKLLLDPYARAIEGGVKWHPSVFAYRFEDPDGPPNEDDSAPYMPKSIVTQPYFDWRDDRPPRIPMEESVIYEVHVKGFTARHPEIPPHQRGTYAGMAHPASIQYLKSLGVTAIELMPVHQFVHHSHLLEKNLRNYWGYDSIGYFAPHDEYSSAGQRGEQVAEFKRMVQALHAAGIEVILDVVYNHTAEGNHMGPTLSFRGIDDAAYYRHTEGQQKYYMDYTGCGNSLNMRNPYVLQLIMDSLRYWVQEMHVDGFRFDLASALARELHAVERLSAFFDLIQQDPIVRKVKLIAEPWDVGEGGYQVGNFPPQWSEWNGRFRDEVRDFWRGQDQTLPEIAKRFTGSADLYETTGRRPFASINLITCHDGFPLHDLVSYNDKHNDDNGEGSRDGESHNRSWNCGVEGETEDPEVLALRTRQSRNMLATLLLSQGVPMLLAGDELGRTQKGNNNTYCQDNELSWIDWKNADQDLLDFVRQLIQLRRRHPVFQRRRWFRGQAAEPGSLPDIAWYRPDGSAMNENDWNAGFAKALGVLLNGRGMMGRNRYGHRPTDDRFYVIISAHHEPLPFRLPKALKAFAWQQVLDTHDLKAPFGAKRVETAEFEVAPRSVRVLIHAE